MKTLRNIKISNQDKLKKLKPLNINRYKNIDLDHLMMYAIGQLQRMGVDLAFENIVVATYKFFPKKFSLMGFPSYPDSNRIGKCLWRRVSKKKGWLGGKIHQGFIITEQSEFFIKEAENLLNGLSFKSTRPKATSQTRRKEALLSEIVASPAYRKYREGQEDSISQADFCFLLQGTLDSSPEMLWGNLEALQRFAQELQREDVIRFLACLEERFRNILK